MASVEPTAAEAVGSACAAEVRDEFVRQQSLVAWDVYCPSQLPDGFRLARAGDPRAAPYTERDYVPTADDLNPGGGTFITRLTAAGGRNLWITQGAGASIYARHTAAGPPETTTASASFGDLDGSLFTSEPLGVTAFDARGYGHMINGYGLAPEDVAAVAAAMRPVDPVGPRRALLSLGDLHKVDAEWVFAWRPTVEDVANPTVCDVAVDPGERAATAFARFEPAARPDTPPDAAGHGPFLEQAVIHFDSDATARGYLDRVRQAAVSCAPYSPMEGVTVTVTPLDDPTVGHQSLAFRRSTRSPVQGADADVEMVRAGALVMVLLHWQTVPAGGMAAAINLAPYAELAVIRLRELPSPATTSTANRTPDGAASPPATGIAELDAIIRATLAGDKDTLVASIGYTRMGCVPAQQQLGSPPECLPGEAPGTLVDSFLIAGCDGTYGRAGDAERWVRNSRTPARLFAAGPPAVAGAIDGTEYVLLFVVDDATSSGFWWDIRDGKITGLVQTCLTVIDALGFVGDFIVPPPFGPHASGALTIAGEHRTTFVPPPYYGFWVTGSFDRTIDEAGDTDPFAWSVPEMLVYNGQASWWRVYWHRGEVFDCAQDCAVALAQPDAGARLKALRAGEPVCIIGWTDDAGNIEAQAVYLHPPAYCAVRE